MPSLVFSLSREKFEMLSASERSLISMNIREQFAHLLLKFGVKDISRGLIDARWIVHDDSDNTDDLEVQARLSTGEHSGFRPEGGDLVFITDSLLEGIEQTLKLANVDGFGEISCWLQPIDRGVYRSMKIA